MDDNKSSVPSLLFDVEPDDEGRLWCVLSIAEVDRANLLAILAQVGQARVVSCRGYRNRSLSFLVGPESAVTQGPTTVTLSNEALGTLSTALARGEAEVRIEGTLSLEVFGDDMAIISAFPSG